MEKRQAEKLVSVLERIADSLDKIQTTLGDGLLIDEDTSYLSEIYHGLHPNRYEKFPNVLTDIGNKLSTIAESLD
tara:strand:+ start:245 stop:469 length:225 start_codon:yes stop_codon:yes gene_type:complete